MRDTAAKKRWRLGLIALFIVIAALCTVFRRAIGGMLTQFSDYLAYPFIQRALAVGLSVSLCAALLGVSLVLKRYSMIGDGLSHVGFGALAIAMALGCVSAESAFYPIAKLISSQPMVFTTIIVMALAFLLLRLNASARIKGDAAIALLSTGALALGVIVVSTTPGMNVDITNYMFGSILSVDSQDVIYASAMSCVVVVAFLAFYRQMVAVTFDEAFARATGIRAGLFNMLLSALTAVTIVMGMRLMGTMLISSLIIFPALTSMRVFERFSQVVISSAAISVFCFIVGLMLSCVYSLPTGAAVVAVNAALFGIFHFIGKARGTR